MISLKAWSNAWWNWNFMRCRCWALWQKWISRFAIAARLRTWARHWRKLDTHCQSSYAIQNGIRSSTLVDDLTKIRSPRSCDHVSLHAVSTAWDEFMLHRSTAFSTKNIFVCRLDHSCVIVGSPPHKMQRAATALLFKVEQNVTSQVILRSERQSILAQSVGIVFRQFSPSSAVQVVSLSPDWLLILFK